MDRQMMNNGDAEIKNLRIEEKRANRLEDREQSPNINVLNANLRENSRGRREKPRLQLAPARPRLGVGSGKAVERNVGRIDDLRIQEKIASFQSEKNGTIRETEQHPNIYASNVIFCEDSRRERENEKGGMMKDRAEEKIANFLNEKNGVIRDTEQRPTIYSNGCNADVTESSRGRRENPRLELASARPRFGVGSGNAVERNVGRIDDLRIQEKIANLDVNLHSSQYDEISIQEEVMTADVERASITTDDKAKAKGPVKIIIVVALVLITIIAIGLGVGLSYNAASRKEANRKEDPSLNQFPEVDECASVVLRECLCYDNTATVPTSYEAKYDSLKANFIEMDILPKAFDDHSNPCEPRKLALLWLAEDIIKNNKNPEEHSLITRFALASLFLSFTNNNISPWYVKEGWLTSNKECDWFGIKCDEKRERVIGVDVPANGLKGTIPPEISLLSELSYLKFAENSISGTIPTEIGVLTKLTALQLVENSISGAIPAEIGQLSSLTYLSLYRNTISGTIPTEILLLTNLRSLILKNNRLVDSIPREIGNLTNLLSLSLSQNQLVNTIPSGIGYLTKLSILQLGANKLSCAIPSEIGYLQNLEALELRKNKLTGSIPTTIGWLASLEMLQLDSNRLSGPIPTEIGSCTSLSDLSLGVNRLGSTIPSEIGALQELKYLRIKDNKLSGSIPTHLSDCQRLKLLHVNDNPIKGTMPSELGKLSSLVQLISCNTDMTGSMPSEICDLKDVKLTALKSSVMKCNCCDSCY